MTIFVNKVDRVRDDLDRLPSGPTFEDQHCSESLTHFKAVSEDEVKNIILKSPKKMCLLDPLPVDLLFNCVDIMLLTITRLIPDSLSSGKFPDVFKEAIVKPLLKKSILDPNDLKNYRPVSNLPFLSKS